MDRVRVSRVGKTVGASGARPRSAATIPLQLLLVTCERRAPALRARVTKRVNETVHSRPAERRSGRVHAATMMHIRVELRVADQHQKQQSSDVFQVVVFPILTVPEDVGKHDEPMGTKEKFWWETDEGVRYLFKLSRSGLGEQGREGGV